MIEKYIQRYPGSKVMWIALLLCTAPVSVLAQSNQLSLQDAINQARANNPLILQRQLDMVHSDWTINVLQADNRPTVSVSTVMSRLGEAPTVPVNLDGEPELIQLGGENSFRTRLEFNQKLFDFGRTSHRLQAARFHQQSQRASYDSEVQQIAVWVKQAYFSVVHNQRMDSLFAVIVDQKEELEQITQARFRERVLLEPALLQARAEVQLAVAKQAQIQGEIDKGRSMLAKLMGIDNKDFTLIGDIPDYSEILLADNLVDDLYTKALESRPEFRKYQSEISQQRALLRSLRSSQRPLLGLQADFTYYGPKQLFGEFSSFGGQGLKSYNWKIGLAFEVPLFDGGKTRAKIKQVTVQSSQFDAAIRQLELQIKSDLEIALDDFRRLQLVQQGNVLLHEASRANLALGRTQLENGVLSQLAYIQLTVVDINSAVLLAQQTFEMAQSIISLESIVGHELMFESFISEESYETTRHDASQN